MTISQTRKVIRLFLQDHPEHKKNVRDDVEHGPLLRREAIKTFAKWSAKKQFCDPIRAMEFTEYLEQLPPEAAP